MGLFRRSALLRPSHWALALTMGSGLGLALLAPVQAQDLVGCQLVDGQLSCVPGVSADPQSQIRALRQQINTDLQQESAVQQQIDGLQQLVLQALIEMEAAQQIGALPHQRSPERTTHRNGHRERLLSTKAGDLELRIPKLRSGSFFPSLLEPRRRIDRALWAVVRMVGMVVWM